MGPVDLLLVFAMWAVMPRMNILNAIEREAFDSPPVFNSFQRKQYFDFPSTPIRRWPPQSGLAEACKLIKYCIIAGIISTFRRS
jgi:hypothetical protein